MVYDYAGTHTRILESASRQFLELGFSGASIRQICKDAGVTNGAFYAHFKSKEDLFGQLVGPAIDGLVELHGKETSRYMEIGSTEGVLESLDIAFLTDEIVVHHVYEHANAFRLLLTASGGTSFERFPKALVEEETRGTMTFFELCRPFVRRPENMSGNIAAQVSSFIVWTVFDCLLSGLPEGEAIREAQLASEFCIAGLRRIWDI